jgi:lipopolysaccharide transport system ATP-binding protein
MTSGMQKIIQLQSVSLGYRQKKLFSESKYHQVLQDITLDIYPGETLGIIGRNGAGKSSLLRLLAGIIAPDKGSVERYGRRVVLLSYQLGFNRMLTGRENAIHSALLQGVERDKIEGRMGEVIAFSGLEDAIDDPLSTYSSGMKARLGFAVAIQSNADVILVDEALGVGDHAFREKSVTFMKQWISSDKTVVFVSHDENAVQNLCTRVVWLEGGRIVANGPAKEIVQSYYEYDSLVSSFSVSLGMTEAEVRAHDNNRNPMKILSQMRSELQELWNVEDAIVDKASPVRYYRPKKNMMLSALVENECGPFSWVENAKLIVEGEEDRVRDAYDACNELAVDMARALKITEHQFHMSSGYSKLLSVMTLLDRN